MNRLITRFDALKAENRAAFVTFVTAGDPDPTTSLDILKGLPAAGADVIELGMPFTDPSADGPAIDKAAQRALKAGASMTKTLSMVQAFREDNQDTPIVLMGYFNPVMAYGIEAFAQDAANAGVDGLIIVDLPPEEDSELRIPAAEQGISTIRLATPTTDAKRLPVVLSGSSGFVYYVAVAGVTGVKSAAAEDIGVAVSRIKAETSLPVAVGFGIKTAADVASVADVADGVVVGSAIVNHIAENLDHEGIARPDLVSKVLTFVKQLAAGVSSH